MSEHPKRTMRRHWIIVVLGAAIAAGFWLAEGMLHFLVFDRRSVWDILLPATAHELWMRSLITCTIFGFGAYAQLIINKLRESRERYRALFENAPDAIFLADAESGEILDANPAASRLLLRPHEQIVRLHQSELHPPAIEDDSRKFFTEYIDRIRQGESAQLVEHVALRSDGAEVPVEIAAKSVRIEGRPVLQSIFRDFTERRRTEEKLKEAELRYRTVAEFAYDWEYWEAPDGSLLYVSPSCERITGYRVEEFIERPGLLQELVIPEDGRTWCQHHRDALETPKLWEVQFRIRRRDGQVCWIEHTCRPVTDTKGVFLGFRASNRDVTGRKKTEEDLEEEHRKHTILLDNLPCVAMILKKGTREIVASNKTAGKLGAVIGKTCFGTCAERDDPCPFCLAPEVWATNERRHLEVEYRGRWYDGTWVPLTEDLYVHYILDITDHKRAEIDLVRYQAQLRSLVSELVATEERERKEIEAALHDDLLQKLALCKMRLDELRKSETLKDRANSLNEIAESVREMIRSTRSLTFDLTSPVLYDIGLEAAIRDWLDREVCGKYDIVFEFEDDGQSRELGNDLRVMLYRAVRELCTNVIKHSRASRAKVQVRNNRNNVEIIVEDDGVGIEYQNPGNDTGDFSHRGGLGLFGIRERLDHFGASMKIDSKVGAGTRIHIIVPSHRQETAEKTRN